MYILEVLLLSLSANLDTFTVAISYGIKKVKLCSFTVALVTILTTISTFLSMYFSSYIIKILPIEITSLIGSIILVCIGSYMIIDHFRKKNIKTRIRNISSDKKLKYLDLLDEPVRADKDMSGDLSPKECIALSFALSINNLGIGIAASIAGIDIWLNTFFTFLITLLSLVLGLYLGRYCLSNVFGKYAGLISGIIIALIGILEYCM